MNDPILIREALPSDYGRVLQLIQELASFEKEPDAVKITVADLIDAASGDDPQVTCFVAEVAGQVVGMALCYFRFSTWKGKTVHLEDLIVTEHMRNKGVGKALYNQVLKHAHSHGVKRVEWVVLNWNTNAIAFYESTGASLLKDWYLAQLDENALQQYISNL